MKHILSLLTIALAFTAATASAIDYYENANVSYTYYGPRWNGDTDKVIKEQIVNYGDYSIVRTAYSQWEGLYLYNHDSLWKIRVNNDNVDIYIADWIDNIGDEFQEDALKNKINKFGYYYVGTNDGETIDDWSKAERIQIENSPWNDNVITRYGYKLGTFNAGDEIEVYMEYNGGSVKSNSTQWNGGGYGDGVYEVDKLALYQNNDNVAAARKAMPLAMLDTGNGHRVFFGVYSGGSAVGSPLPGGLPIALIAGLFGLGFWYVRRRKAIVS